MGKTKTAKDKNVWIFLVMICMRCQATTIGTLMVMTNRRVYTSLRVACPICGGPVKRRKTTVHEDEVHLPGGGYLELPEEESDEEMRRD